jgi:predicted small metal-binding protein
MDGGCADPEACAKATRAVDDAMAASYDAEKELVDHLKQVHGMTIMQYAMSDTGCEVCRKLVKKM